MSFEHSTKLEQQAFQSFVDTATDYWINAELQHKIANHSVLSSGNALRQFRSTDTSTLAQFICTVEHAAPQESTDLVSIYLSKRTFGDEECWMEELYTGLTNGRNMYRAGWASYDAMFEEDRLYDFRNAQLVWINAGIVRTERLTREFQESLISPVFPSPF